MTTGLTDFFKYNLWANLRVLDACANLNDTHLDQTIEGTYGSIRQKLMHIIAGEEGYVQRFTGKRLARPLREVDHFPGFDDLRQRARQSGEGLITIAERFHPDHILHLTYDGQVYAVPAILVLIQAITHGSDHRSQIATLLSQQHLTSPEVDGWAYYFEEVKSHTMGSKTDEQHPEG
jgi:uncharacterized damage-inducible protein DinB